jgi:hypothetical protein
MTGIKTAVAFAIGSLFAGAALAQGNYSIEQRDRNEDMRIQQGIRSGELTRQEAYRLENERAQVERMERRARADGTVSSFERARIDRAQDRVSRDIYRESHDAQQRGDWRGHDGRRGYDQRWRGNEHGWRGNEHAWRGNEHNSRGNDQNHTWNHRDGGQTTPTPTQSDHSGRRTGGDFNRGRTDSSSGRPAQVQQAPSQQARVQTAQYSRPASGGRQGGSGGHRTR